MTDRHELKILPQYFRDVMSGKKTFEVRKDDRDYKVGDMLRLKEWLPLDREYTGSGISMRVTYILRDPEYVKEGYIIMGIEYWGIKP